MTRKLPEEKDNDRLVSLEARLNASDSVAEQLELLSRLVEDTTFSQPARAQQYLDAAEKLLADVQGNAQEYRIIFLLQKAFLENQLYNYTLSEKTYRLALTMLENHGPDDLRLTALLDYIAVLTNLQRFEEVGKVLDQAHKRLHDRAAPKHLFHFYLRSGYFSLHINELTDAIRHFRMAEDHFAQIAQSERSAKDWYLLSLLYSGKGHVYERDDEPEEEIAAFRKAVQICEEHDLRTRLSWNYLNMGNSYMRLQQLEPAKEYFFKTIRVQDDLNKQSRASAFANLGRIALAERKFEEARKYFFQAHAIYQSRRKADLSNMALLNMWMGELCMLQGDLELAEEYFVQAMDDAEQGNHYDLLQQACEHLALLFEKLGNYEAAYGYLRERNKYLRKHYAKERQGKVRELELKYELEKRRREAEELRGHAMRLRLQALRAQMNPHFIFNVISSIQSVIRSGDVDDADKFLQYFSELMRQSLNFSEADFITLEQEVGFLQNYLLLNAQLRFSGQMEWRIIIEKDLEEEMIYVPSMIVQPLVENAVEHGIRPLQDRKGLVVVTFSWYDDFNILCEVRDNGIGIEAAAARKDLRPKKHKSRGMEIVKDRLQLLHQERGLGVQPLHIIDLAKRKPQGEAVGTLVKVILPAENTPPKTRMKI